jgi:hypothetical protein
MHFRNGAMAFTYMGFLLMKFVDLKKGAARREALGVLSEPSHASSRLLAALAMPTLA